MLWSVISAAFISSNSVTACAIAGSTYGLQLLWVLTFATLGTVWLQKAAARITTGYDLGLLPKPTLERADGVLLGRYLVRFLSAARLIRRVTCWGRYRG